LTVFSTELVSVSVVIWVSPSSGLSYGLTPSGLARGDIVMSQLMVRRNMNVAMRYHELVISPGTMKPAGQTGAARADPGYRLEMAAKSLEPPLTRSALAVDFKHAGGPRKTG
jgi:hypothetical protein